MRIGIMLDISFMTNKRFSDGNITTKEYVYNKVCVLNTTLQQHDIKSVENCE